MIAFLFYAKWAKRSKKAATGEWWFSSIMAASDSYIVHLFSICFFSSVSLISIDYKPDNPWGRSFYANFTLTVFDLPEKGFLIAFLRWNKFIRVETDCRHSRLTREIKFIIIPNPCTFIILSLTTSCKDLDSTINAIKLRDNMFVLMVVVASLHLNSCGHQ